MKSKHEARSVEEAIKVFLKELPDPKRTNIPAVSDHFMIGEEDVILTAQRAKSSTGFRWIIDSRN